MDRDSKGLGIVIKSERWGNNDRLLTLLTPYGMTRARLYGARSGRHSLKIPLYTEGTFDIETSRSGESRVKDVAVLSYHDYLSSDYKRKMNAALLSEMVLSSRTSEPVVYQLFCQALDALENVWPETVVIAFLVHFLSLEGLSGDWRRCPVCSRVYREGEVIGFSGTEGVAACSDCDTMSGALPLPPNARKYLARTLELSFQDSLTLSVSETQGRRIYRYLLRSLRISFPERLRTLDAGLLDMGDL